MITSPHKKRAAFLMVALSSFVSAQPVSNIKERNKNRTIVYAVIAVGGCIGAYALCKIYKTSGFTLFLNEEALKKAASYLHPELNVGKNGNYKITWVEPGTLDIRVSSIDSPLVFYSQNNHQPHTQWKQFEMESFRLTYINAQCGRHAGYSKRTHEGRLLNTQSIGHLVHESGIRRYIMGVPGLDESMIDQDSGQPVPSAPRQELYSLEHAFEEFHQAVGNNENVVLVVFPKESVPQDLLIE